MENLYKMSRQQIINHYVSRGKSLRDAEIIAHYIVNKGQPEMHTMAEHWLKEGKSDRS